MAATLDEIHDFISTHKAIAELRQDVFVLTMTGFKKSGFFVEFGLMDGIYCSNTYVLETEHNWSGIVCEPARVFHDKVRANRKCAIDFRAVTGLSGEVLQFKETDTNLGLSSIVAYSQDMHANTRAESEGAVYDVTTVSLCDLLDQHNAPLRIDYISIDTEGAELPVLQAFDFSKYQVDIFTIEHNYETTPRKAIYDILATQGYIRVFTDLSQYDDWYIHSRLMSP